MPLPERAIGEVSVVTVTGDLKAGSDAGLQLRETMRTLLEAGRRKLVLDLSAMAYVDSTGLGEIVHAYASTKNRGGTLKLLRPARRVVELLRITKLDSVLESSDSEGDLLAAFSADSV